MKKLILTLIAVHSLAFAYSQNASLKLFVEDALGRKDTLIIGANENSNIGIDAVFGEQNIFGTPVDSLDARVIQRDSLNHHCMRYHFRAFPPVDLYFPANSDSKVDIRPFDPFSSASRQFEIYIKAVAYPLIVRADFSEIASSFLAAYSGLVLLDGNCEIKANEVFASWNTKDILFLLPDGSSTLVVILDTEVGLKEVAKVNWKMFPNPATTTLSISNAERINGSVTITDIYGRSTFMERIPVTADVDLNIENLKQGVYFIALYNNDGQLLGVRKLMKE